MDLPALLERAPELALIDELAHSNAPGVEHAKRYEDIVDVLAAGIDVFSTVNVQHLESLNDRVAELTGTRVRETVPDSVIAVADEIVLVDLTPEALIARLQAGKVYPQERVEAALNHFFRIENLSALREVALREVAEEVETKRRVAPLTPLGTREVDAAEPQAVQERLLALITPQSQRVVRRAARSAQRLDGELDLLYVRPYGREPNARGARAARGAAPARLHARRAPAARGGRRRRRNRRPGRARARHDLRADGRAEQPPRAAPPVGAAPRPPAQAAARRRPQDRRGSR